MLKNLIEKLSKLRIENITIVRIDNKFYGYSQNFQLKNRDIHKTFKVLDNIEYINDELNKIDTNLDFLIYIDFDLHNHVLGFKNQEIKYYFTEKDYHNLCYFVRNFHYNKDGLFKVANSNHDKIECDSSIDHKEIGKSFPNYFESRSYSKTLYCNKIKNTKNKYLIYQFCSYKNINFPKKICEVESL